MMRQQRTANVLLLVYVLVTIGALMLLFLTWDRGPMSRMANGIKILYSFGCIFITTVALFVALFFVKGSIRVYAMATAMLCFWGLVVVYNLGSDIVGRLHRVGITIVWNIETTQIRTSSSIALATCELRKTLARGFEWFIGCHGKSCGGMGAIGGRLSNPAIHP